MTDKEFRALLDLIMRADPWPVENDGGANQAIIESFANVEAAKRHYDGWIEAYRKFTVA